MMTKDEELMSLQEKLEIKTSELQSAHSSSENSFLVEQQSEQI